MRILLFLLSTTFFLSCKLSVESPTLIRAFQQPASSQEVISFCQRVASKSDFLTLEPIGKNQIGTPLIAIRANNPTPENSDPLRVLIFAQQHGNEQSGKEATLLLLSDFAKGQHRHWLQNLDIWIIPQLNPYGSDKNQRNNADGLDLNRDHIVRQAPETRALHTLFTREMHHVTIDIHEYQPFRESWKEFGGYKTFDVQVGIPTNPNVDAQIRDFAYDKVLPAIENHLNQKGFSFHNYLVGPVPDEGRTRHSTVDFDDGRQSFGILGTMAFIYEGINGPDSYIENLESRTFGQYEALIAMLNFLHENAEKARLIVESARQNLHNAKVGEKVAIRMEHFPGPNPLLLPLISSRTGADTLVVVNNYHPIVEPTLEVTRPKAYLIPRNDTLVVNFLKLHSIKMEDDFNLDGHTVESWFINQIETSIDEELENRFPIVKTTIEPTENLLQEYYYISTSQLHSNFMVSIFEPQSMLGLAQRNGFHYLLQEKSRYPVMRVE